MSHSLKIQKPTIHKLLKKDLYIKKAFPIKKLLGLNPSRTIRMRIFNNQKETSYKENLDKENFNKKSQHSSTIEYNKDNLKEVNDSIIKLIHKANYLQNKTKRNYEEKKESNILFSKRLNNMKKYEKEIEKMDISKSNSAIKFNQSFSIFNNIVKKYKERDGILYTKDLFKRDIFQETPIVSNNENKMKKYYIYNYDKYVKKTNRNNSEILKTKTKNKLYKKLNDLKEIKCDNLSVTNYYKKLINITQKKIYESQDKNFDPNKFKYHFINDGEKVKKEIPILQKEIVDLKSLFNTMEDIKNKNINNKLSDRYKTPNSSNKKILTNIEKEQMIDSSRDYKSTKRETNYQNKKYQINTFSNIKLLSPISLEHPENKNKNKIRPKKLFIRRAFSKNTSKSFFMRNRYKEGKSIMTQKTKSTFYITKNKNSTIGPLTPRYEIKNSMDLNNEIIKDAEDAYEELKLISLDNKYLILDKIEQYLEKKGYNVERIKNSLNRDQLYNFFDRIKDTVMNYNCKPNVNELYSHMGKNVSENLSFNLDKITKMDKEISATENYYYLSLIKG